MKLSIVIATKNRAQALPGSLDAAARALAFAKLTDAEIIVVDNGSTDDTAQVVTAWRATASVPVLLVYEAKKGLSAARNAGVRAAQGELVIFIDDDCHMREPYLAQALAYDAQDAGLVLRSGSVKLGDPTDLPLTIKAVEGTQRWQKPLTVQQEGTLLGSLIGCNMMARRALLDLIGPFDEKLGVGTPCSAAEDTDYFYRAYLAGALLEMVPDMVVDHFHGRKAEAERVRLLNSYAIGNGALCLKYLFIYPALSRQFLWGLKGYLLSLGKPRQEPSWQTGGQRLRSELTGMVRYAMAILKEKAGF